MVSMQWRILWGQATCSTILYSVLGETEPHNKSKHGHRVGDFAGQALSEAEAGFKATSAGSQSLASRNEEGLMEIPGLLLKALPSS